MAPASRSNQRRDLISLFTGLEPGAEISFEEIFALTEVDGKRSTDRALLYSVREHCRDVLGFIIDAVPGKGYRKIRDDELAGRVLERRQDRIHRQSVRGMAESVAVMDFGALSQQEQRRVLAHQAVLGTLALGSRLELTRSLAKTHEQEKLQRFTADAVIEAAMRMKQ
jgi:hypothetical protein